MLAALAVLASAAVAVVNVPPSGADPGGSIDGAIVRTALASAARSGDAAPTSVQWVVTSRRDANRTAGELLPGSLGAERVYFVAMMGHFRLSSSNVPRGLEVPTGTVETLTIATDTRLVRDFAISDVAPNLAALGPVTRVDLRTTGSATGDEQPRTPARGSAANPCRPTHCYATAQLIVNPPEGFAGIYGTLRSNCIAVPKPKSGFVDNELWIVSGSHWVEAGITLGSAASGGFYPSAVFFWADQRPAGGGYHEHYGAAATLRKSHAVAIKYTGTGPTWAISGAISGTSTQSIAFPADYLEGGVESTSFKNTTYGTVSKAGYWDTAGTQHPGWSTADVSPHARQTGGKMSFHWLDKYGSWRGSQGGTC